MTKFLLLLSLFICASNAFTQNLTKIDIESELNKKGNLLNLSDYITNISYVPLETNKNCLLDGVSEIGVTDKEIVVRTFSDCLVFDRKTGAFRNQIGRKGKGPGEYLTTTGLINPVNKSVYLMGKNLMKYNFEGAFVKIISGPKPDANNYMSMVAQFTYLNDLLVGYPQNVLGKESTRLIVFNQDGGIVKLFNNYNRLSSPANMMVISVFDSQFYHFNNNLYFKEDYTDTLFQVTKDQLIPRMRLYLGKYQKGLEDKWKFGNSEKQIADLRNILESNSFLFFDLTTTSRKSYQCIYNKKTGKLTAAERATNIVNDIDNFMIPSPVAISTDGYLISYVNAFTVLDWFKKNPEKASKLAPNLQKLRNIKETDNPVLMIAKIKE